MSASRQDRNAAVPDYAHPKRRSANAIFVPLWAMLAILGASWEQPDNKKIVAALLAIGAACAAATFASRHLRLSGRRTTPAKALGVVLIVTLGCSWASEYWCDALLLVIAKIIALGGMAASLVLSIIISIMGLRVVKPDATAKRRD